MKQAITPHKVEQKAKKLIELGEENVDFVVEQINSILTIESAKEPGIKRISIGRNSLYFPLPSWKRQSHKSVKKALKRFENYWIVELDCDILNVDCIITFTPKVPV